MASSEDTEITLGTGKLLVLFFFLVGVCALFFGLGYSLGRKSEPGITAASAAVPQTGPPAGKNANNPAAPGMTFYKSVEQKDANPELTPAANKTDTPAANDSPAASAMANVPDPATSATLPTAGYFVQVVAVSKQEDADSVVDALKKKNYAAFVAPAAADKLFRVQVGPFTDVKEAEAMRARLIDDGYNPILKK